MSERAVRGRDHTVLPGADGTVVRRRTDPAGEGLDVTREAALLSLIGQLSPLPVPRVLRVLEDSQTLVMERVPGTPLLDVLPDLPDQAAWSIGAQLGELLAVLHRTPPEWVAAIVPEEPAVVAEYHQDAERLFVTARRHLPAGSIGAVEDFLDAPPPPPAPRLRLCHNDLGAEHVFVGPPGDRVTGVIDWSDASLGDPGLDLGLIWRDLGEDGFAAALGRLPADDAERDDLVVRSRFFARVKALEDVAFGLETCQDAYLHNATRALGRLF